MGRLRESTRLEKAVEGIVGWRKQIQMLWRIKHHRVKDHMILVEYRVRPRKKAATCPFRAWISHHRKFKQKKGVKFTVAAAVTGRQLNRGVAEFLNDAPPPPPLPETVEGLIPALLPEFPFAQARIQARLQEELRPAEELVGGDLPNLPPRIGDNFFRNGEIQAPPALHNNRWRPRNA